MAEKKQSPENKTGNSYFSFPCGTLEKMFKNMRVSITGETDGNNCSSIMKQLIKGKEGSSDYKTLMQKICAAKDGDIECETLINELFRGIEEDESDKPE